MTGAPTAGGPALSMTSTVQTTRPVGFVAVSVRPLSATRKTMPVELSRAVRGAVGGGISDRGGVGGGGGGGFWEGGGWGGRWSWRTPQPATETVVRMPRAIRGRVVIA